MLAFGVGSSRLAGGVDVPTAQERGPAGREFVGWHGAYAPAAVIAMMRDALCQAFLGMVVKDYSSTCGTESLDLVGENIALPAGRV